MGGACRAAGCEYAKLCAVRVLSLLLVCGSLSCSSSRPPAGWPQGGMPVQLPSARWVVMGSTVDLRPSGQVYLDGDYFMTIDPVGRVFDEENQPIALLYPDGSVRGPDDQPLGVVGYLHASQAATTHAWITLTPQGPVIRYDGEGERHDFGIWIGCSDSPQTQLTCTLVTHLMGNRIIDAANNDRMSPSFTVGPSLTIGR